MFNLVINLRTISFDFVYNGDTCTLYMFRCPPKVDNIFVGIIGKRGKICPRENFIGRRE